MDYPVVFIEAVDWGLWPEQVPVNTAFSLMPCRVVGFLVGEGPAFIALAHQHFFEDGDVRAVTVIPRGTIRKMVRFKYPEESAVDKPAGG